MQKMNLLQFKGAKRQRERERDFTKKRLDRWEQCSKDRFVELVTTEQRENAPRNGWIPH